MIRWDLLEGKVEFRPEVHEASAKQETEFEATLVGRHIWAVGLRFRLCGALLNPGLGRRIELKAAESQASLTYLLTSHSYSNLCQAGG